MKRADLEHILRASKGITGEREFIVLGSQSIQKDLSFVSALLRHKLIRPSRIERLIESAEDLNLRGRLSEALLLCRAR